MTVISYTIVSPTFGVVSLTTLKTARSACFGVTVESSVLFSGFGSGVVEVATAVFVRAGAGPDDGAVTVATMVRKLDWSDSIVPTVQTPVPGTYVPVLALWLTYCRPVGNRSLTTTFCAALGPRLSRVTVNVTLSPTFGVALSTVFETTRSACWGLVGVRAVLLRLFGSQTSLFVIVTVLKLVPGAVAVTTIVSVSGLFTPFVVGTFGILHTFVVALNVPADGVAETKATLAGSVSVTSTPVAADVPRLKRLTV